LNASTANLQSQQAIDIPARNIPARNLVNQTKALWSHRHAAFAVRPTYAGDLIIPTRNHEKERLG